MSISITYLRVSKSPNLEARNIRKISIFFILFCFVNHQSRLFGQIGHLREKKNPIYWNVMHIWHIDDNHQDIYDNHHLDDDYFVMIFGFADDMYLNQLHLKLQKKKKIQSWITCFVLIIIMKKTVFFNRLVDESRKKMFVKIIDHWFSSIIILIQLSVQ